MIVAITGANGFIGSHLCTALRSAGHDVRPIVRGDFDSGAIETRLTGADVVIHAAGATRARTLHALRAANVALTSRVASAARAACVKRLLLLSSQAAAGPASSPDNPVTETDAPRPVEDYGRSKLEAELVVRDSGVPFTIVRPAAVYGPGDGDFLPLFRLAHRGIAIHPGNRGHWLSIVHVHDLVGAIQSALHSPAAVGREYFVANRDPVTWDVLFSVAAKTSGAALRIDVNVPPPLVSVAALAGDLFARFLPRPPLVSSGKVALARPRYWICSADRLAREVGFAPAIPVATGFAETERWYAANGWL